MGNVQLYGQTEKKMKSWYKNDCFFYLDQFQYYMVDCFGALLYYVYDFFHSILALLNNFTIWPKKHSFLHIKMTSSE